MQKTLSEFAALPEADLIRMIERGPVLLTSGEEPRFVAQSIDEFEAMVRRLRHLEALSTRSRGKVLHLRVVR